MSCTLILNYQEAAVSYVDHEGPLSGEEQPLVLGEANSQKRPKGDSDAQNSSDAATSSRE